jgi:hypothetical protein
MNAARLTLCALLALACSAAAAETVCVKGSKPGDCFELQPIPGAHEAAPAVPAPSPAPSTPAAAVAGSPNAASAANAVTIGGDTSRSTVAVFPAPSTAAVPAAQACIVTRSTAGGFGWNLIQGASSEQHSDPVCVLQWLLERTTDAAQAQALRAAIVKRIGGL